MKTAEEKYPELNDIAEKISQQTLWAINIFAPIQVEGMPYARQFVLEEVIKKLEEVV